MSKNKKVIEDDIPNTPIKTDDPKKGYRSPVNEPSISKESKRRIYKDYADYLKSDKWKQVKADYVRHEQVDQCLCCSRNFKEEILKVNFHHFRYAKDWNDDTYENLIIVCEDCHNIIHAMITHGSEFISLRSYYLELNKIVGMRKAAEEKDIINDSLWCDAEGDFEISQYGMNPRKSMIVKFKTQHQPLIEYFEYRRDQSSPIEEAW